MRPSPRYSRWKALKKIGPTMRDDGQDIRDAADLLVATGMFDAGYVFVDIHVTLGTATAMRRAASSPTAYFPICRRS